MIKKIFKNSLSFILILLCVASVCFAAPTTQISVSAAKRTTLKITKQPTAVVAKKGATAKVTFSARGDKLKYTWYIKDAKAKKFTKASCTKKYYQVKMSASRNKRQVYCLVKDKYGKSVKTKTVTLYMGTPLKITKQPSSVSATEGKTTKVSFSVRGDSLKYTWYYKNAGAKKFTKSGYTKKTFQTTMSAACNGRQVYCVIKDKYGKSVKTKTVSLLRTMSSGIYTFYNAKTKKYLSFNNNSLTLSKTAKYWDLKESGNSFYVYANNSDLLLDIDNAYVASGTTVKLWQLTGYDVQKWKIKVNSNGTYSFLSAVNNKYCLGFKNGRAVLQKRSSGNTAQEWKAVNSSSKFYRSVSSKNKIIELQLPTNITNVISLSRLQKWANDLETAYNSFYQLTSYKPYKKVIVEAYKPCSYIGYVIDNSNIIHVDKDFIYNDLKKMYVRQNDWNFCVLHEMGHMFDNERAWNFETEMMTDLKLSYVLEKNGASAAPSEFGAETAFKGKDIIKAFEILGSGFSSSYDIYSCTERFLEIKNDIGWTPFNKTFRYLQSNNKSIAGLSKQKRFEKFVSLLSTYSGKNIRSYFSNAEWNTVINTLK